MREADLQDRILKWLRGHGGWWVKYHVGPRYSLAGIPDIIGSYRGRFIALEVKLPGKQPTKLQQATQTQMRDKGKAIVRVVQSLDEVQQLLYNLDRRRKANHE